MEIAHLALLIARDLSVIVLIFTVVGCMVIGLGATLYDIQESTLPARERNPLKRVLALHQLSLLIMTTALLLAYRFFRPVWIPVDLACLVVAAGLLLIAKVALVHKRVEQAVLARHLRSLQRFNNASTQE